MRACLFIILILAAASCLPMAGLAGTLVALPEPQTLFVLKGHRGAVHSAAFSPDGKLIVTASWDGTARVWDAQSGELRYMDLGDEGHSLYTAAFSPDGNRIVTGGIDGVAVVWGVDGAIWELALKGHSGSILSAFFSPDGSRIVTAGTDRTAMVWDAVTGRRLLKLKGHKYPVSGAAFSPDGRQIVAKTWDGTMMTWDAQSGNISSVVRTQGNHARPDAFNPDGTRMVGPGPDFTARVWKVAYDPEELKELERKLRTPAVLIEPGLGLPTAEDAFRLRWDGQPAGRAP